ncbi:MAG TPA: hypothetical protein VLA37_05795, partial [Sphingomonadaceae bacterium]|nr:hypothetical protein [Sphingomonadaceae bacterium]
MVLVAVSAFLVSPADAHPVRPGIEGGALSIDATAPPVEAFQLADPSGASKQGNAGCHATMLAVEPRSARMALEWSRQVFP